jgi:alpha-L-fucosidase
MKKADVRKYEPTWESLRSYSAPKWFEDAKFGIFIHWGVYAVPAYRNEWYPRNMYIKDSPEFKHHREIWGPQSELGYKDFIPMFKAENWDPDEWAALFKQSGAKYVVPVAEHHDGFAMYKSEHTKWNSANMGPCRNIIAELEKAVRKEGLKFGVSTHRAFNWRYYTYSEEFDTVNPKFSGLYSPEHGKDEPASKAFLENWFARIREVIDRFQPDVLYFDFGWHFDEFAPYRPKIAAYYYNRAISWGKEVVLTYKDKFPEGTAVFDVERGKLEGISEHHWQTDTSVSYNSWCYIKNDELKTVTTIVHDLVDIVSKNGNLLLNVGPKADGTIPDEIRKILLDVGEWLKINGEAIYGTRSWHTYGEGETKVTAGHLTERENKPFTASDIRFTKRGNILYAICLGWPGKKAQIRTLTSNSAVKTDMISEITMLGLEEALPWTQDKNGLHIKTPPKKPCQHAYTFKIMLKRLV